jgi:hypothetical protein
MVKDIPMTLTNPSKVVTVTRCGVTFRASLFTVALLDRTLRRLRRRFPWARLQIIQPCYHTGVDRSAGTHDKDCVLDVRIVGLTWLQAQRFLRNAGWAAWWRHTGPWAAKSNWHIHMAAIPTGLHGHPDALTVGKAYKHLGLVVGEYIDGGYTTSGHVEASSQVVDYFNHAEGLSGEHFTGYDHTWFPPNIAATVYKFNPADVNHKGIAA